MTSLGTSLISSVIIGDNVVSTEFVFLGNGDLNLIGREGNNKIDLERNNIVCSIVVKNEKINELLSSLEKKFPNIYDENIDVQGDSQGFLKIFITNFFNLESSYENFLLFLDKSGIEYTRLL